MWYVLGGISGRNTFVNTVLARDTSYRGTATLCGCTSTSNAQSVITPAPNRTFRPCSRFFLGENTHNNPSPNKILGTTPRHGAGRIRRIARLGPSGWLGEQWHEPQWLRRRRALCQRHPARGQQRDDRGLLHHPGLQRDRLPVRQPDVFGPMLCDYRLRAGVGVFPRRPGAAHGRALRHRRLGM